MDTWDIDLVRCCHCKGEIPPDSKFCPECGGASPLQDVSPRVRTHQHRKLPLNTTERTAIVIFFVVIACALVPVTRALGIGSPERVTVSQLFNNMLRYDGKRVRVDCQIVDRCDNGWVLADDRDEYMKQCVDEVSGPLGGRPPGEIVRVRAVPKLPNLFLFQQVSVVGRYEARSNTFSIESVR